MTVLNRAAGEAFDILATSRNDGGVSHQAPAQVKRSDLSLRMCENVLSAIGMPPSPTGGPDYVWGGGGLATQHGMWVGREALQNTQKSHRGSSKIDEIAGFFRITNQMEF
jgi:hypothetical protein